MKDRGKGDTREPAFRRRPIQEDPERSQLLERGEGPSEDELIDPEVASISETTVEGGPGTDAAYREGGPMHDAHGPENSPSKGTGGEGGYSTLGGGVDQDEGNEEDVSHAGD
jgi:hypothetical protein